MPLGSLKWRLKETWTWFYFITSLECWKCCGKAMEYSSQWKAYKITGLFSHILKFYHFTSSPEVILTVPFVLEAKINRLLQDTSRKPNGWSRFILWCLKRLKWACSTNSLHNKFWEVMRRLMAAHTYCGWHWALDGPQKIFVKLEMGCHNRLQVRRDNNNNNKYLFMILHGT